MPLVRLEVSAPVPQSKKETLLGRSSKLVAEVTGKPEAYVMITLIECAAVLAGIGGPIAFADVRAIGGLDKKTNGALAKGLSSILKEELEIPIDRIYLNFTDVAATHWGSRGTTMG